MAIFLAQRFMPACHHYGPIDAEALTRYRFFQRLGFFGVARGTRHGAATFLRVSQAILRQPRSVLWMTPEGHFSDPQQRPVQLQLGLGALARRLDGVAFLPLAIEYVFWEERFPEILLRFGEVIPVSSCDLDNDAYTVRFAQHLQSTQDALASVAFMTPGWPCVLAGVVVDVTRKRFDVPWSGKRMIAMVLVACGLALIPALLFQRNVRLYKPPPPVSTLLTATGERPAISVLIPPAMRPHRFVPRLKRR